MRRAGDDADGGDQFPRWRVLAEAAGAGAQGVVD